MDVQLIGWDPDTNNQRGFMGDAYGIKLGFTLNYPSTLTFSYPQNGLNVNWLTDKDLPMVIVRINGVEEDDCRFVVRSFKANDSDENPYYEFECWGYMTELLDAVVYPNILWEEETYDPKGDKDKAIRMVRVDPIWMIPTGSQEGKVGEVMNRLINEATARQCLPKLQKNFTNTQTTNGINWNSGTIKPKYKAGMPLLEVLQGLVDRGLVDAKMQGYELVLRNPGSIGTDYSVSDPNKVLWYGRDLATTNERTVDKTGVFSVVLSTDEKNRVFESEDQHAPRTRWGRRETFKNFGNTDTYDELKEQTRNYRQNKGDEGISRTFNWEETGEPGQLTPITGYRVGDKLWLDASPFGGPTRETVRIRGYTIEVAEDGTAKGSVSLGALKVTFNGKIAKRMREIDYGSSPGGAGGFPPSDDSVPNPPTSVSLSQQLYMDPSGQNFVMGTVSWVNPTANTDTSPLIDHAHTFVERNVGSLGWQLVGEHDPSVTSMSAGIIPQNTTVQYRVRVTDTNGNTSTWAMSSIITTSSDTTVPGQPSTPAVTAPLSTLKVVWDGLLQGGGALPVDYLITEVHVSTSSGFTPTTGTNVGTFRGKGTFLLNGLTPGTTYYVRLINVDQVGNRSAASNQGSASAAITGLLGTEIADAAVTAAKIADGAVTTPKIFPEAVTTEKLTVAGFSEQLIANGVMEELSQADATKPAGWGINTVAGSGASAWGTNASDEYSGDRCAYFTLAASADAARLYSVRAIPVIPGDIYYVAVAVKNSRAAPNANRIEAWTNATATDAINPAHGSTTITQILATETGHTGYTIREGTITVPAGKTWMTIAVRGNAAGDGSGYTTYVDQVVVRKLIGDALIVNLTASKITAGTLQADVLLSSKFYTDVSPNARVELDGLGFRAYDETNKKTVDISSLDGKGSFEDIQVAGKATFLTTDPETGDSGVSITAEGNGSFKTVFATDLYLGGDSVAALLNTVGRGVIARSTKTLAINRTATGNTREDLFEISADLIAGRVYRVSVDPVVFEGNPAAESGGFRVTYTTNGTQPVDGSTQFGAQYNVTDPGSAANASNTSIDFQKTFVATVTSTHRFLLQLVHSSAGASDLVRITSGKEIRFIVEDLGVEPTDTGNNPGAGTYAQSKNFQYNFDWSDSYVHSSGAKVGGMTALIIDSTTSGGVQSWLRYFMLGFSTAKQATIISDLTGYTINSIKLYMYNQIVAYANIANKYFPRGQAALGIWTHALTNGTSPTTGPVAPNLTGMQMGDINFWNAGQYYGVTLPTSVGTSIAAGTVKGFRIQTPDLTPKPGYYSEYSTYYMASHASRFPYIKINATKY